MVDPLPAIWKTMNFKKSKFKSFLKCNFYKKHKKNNI